METPRKPEMNDTTYWRNVANQGRGSAMTQCLHEACDRIDQLERENAELREALEVERMRLAACGVVALANTPEAAERARAMHPNYMSAACKDVMRAVDEEMNLRALLAK